MFIENRDQFDPRFRFQASMENGTAYFADDEIWLTLTEPAQSQRTPLTQQSLEPTPIKKLAVGTNIRMTFVGANFSTGLVGFKAIDTKVSYFMGDDPAKWQTDLPVWGGVRYTNLYPGIDLEISSRNGTWDWRLIIEDTPTLSQDIRRDLGDRVRLRIEGAEDLQLGGESLEIITSTGNINLPLLCVEAADGSDLNLGQLESVLSGIEIKAPFLRIPTSVERVRLPSSPKSSVTNIGISDDLKISIAKPTNPTPPGISENVLRDSVQASNMNDLLYSTFIGGSDLDIGRAITTDEAGMVYLIGETESFDFPTTLGAFDTSYDSLADVFVVKMNPSNGTLEYATFLGGNNLDYASAISVNEAGYVYVAGATSSTDFPTTEGAFDETNNGWSDAFLIKLSPDGTVLAFATLIGGSGHDGGNDMAVDHLGNAYLTGTTSSSDFPTTDGAFDTSYDSSDAFAVKVNDNGTALEYSTFIGGSDSEKGRGIAVDLSGSAYLTGETYSDDFPITANAVDPIINDVASTTDAYLIILNPEGTNRTYGTFLGGNKHDKGFDVATNNDGEIYVAGYTQSPDFPTTVNAFDPIHNGDYDVFLSRIAADQSGFIYSTYLGGSNKEFVNQDGIAVDSSGSVYLVGSTTSTDFPITADALDTTVEDYDAFLLKLNDDGSTMDYATFLGETEQDTGYGIAIDTNSNIFMIGNTYSSDFPTTSNAFDNSYNGNYDAYVAELGPPIDPNPLPIGFLDLPIAYNNFADAAVGSILGMNDPSRVNSWFDHTYPTYAGSPNWNNDNLTRWDDLFIDANTNINDCVEYWGLGRGCYDGHNGLDFSASHFGNPRDSIYAAAPGTVFWVNDGCVEGQPCNSLYGNHLWVDHGNCYATRYGHLQHVNVQDDDIITDPPNESIGDMGTTGNSHGVHLHFDVFYDDDCDGDWSYDSRTAIDPYGWFGQLEDPWDGPSTYLWMHLLAVRKLVTDAGGDLISPSDFIHLTIPADAVIDRAWVEVWDMPAYYKPTYASGMGSTGRGLWLRVPEWVGASTFQEDLTIQMSYDEAEPTHLHPDYSVIHRWDDEEEEWVALETLVDPDQDIATAQTTTPGRYELLAPRNIPEDVTEPDDDYNASITIPTDGTALSRYFDIPEDEDWFALNAVAGMLYEIETVNLAPEVGTLMELYDQDGFTLLLTGATSGMGDESPTALEGSQLEWQAPYSGTYFIRVFPAPGSILGAESTYQLVMNQEARIYLPLIQR